MQSEIRPLRIGLTGNIGSGKSTAARIFEALGVPVLSADTIGRRIIQEDEETGRKIIGKFGVGITSGASINRKKLASVVFNSPAKKEELEKILHPAIMDSVDREIERISGKDYAIIEAALIYEAALSDKFDYVVLIKADKRLSLERAAKGLNITGGEALRRYESQISQSEKEKLADFVISNNGSLDELKQKVEFLHIVISSLSRKRSADD